jgi:hypothetical protein
VSSRRASVQIVPSGASSAQVVPDPLATPNGGYLKSPAKSASDQGVCGGDMSPPNGTYETRDVKSGSEKRIVAGHVGDITSSAAETPL